MSSSVFARFLHHESITATRSWGVCAKEGHSNVLQRVQNAAARLITGTQEHERGLSLLLRDDLHWLTILQRVQYKLAVTVCRCLRAPRYLADCCVPVSEVFGRQHLRSASRRKLNIPRFRRSTFGTCGLSQSPTRRFGTYCQNRCVIESRRRFSILCVFSLQRTRGVTVSLNRAIQIDILLLTYLLSTPMSVYTVRSEMDIGPNFLTRPDPLLHRFSIY